MTSLGPSSSLCITCGINPKEKFGNCIQCYDKLIREVKCITCKTQYNLKDIGSTPYNCKSCAIKSSNALMLKCLVCNELYNVRAEGTRASTCKTCTDKRFKRKDYIQEVKDEFKNKDYDDFPKFKEEVELEGGLLTSQEMKLYSDTKQVWWVRVIKWILKYI